MRGADWRKRVVSRLMATTNRREKILQSSRVRARQRRLIAGVLIWQRIVSRQWGWGTCPVWVKLDRVGRGYTSFHVRNPPTATVMAGCPVPIPHLAAEAATLGSPLPCAPLDVGAISVCIAARPPNFRREKDLLHFLCIGLFVFNSEILRGNARRGNAPLKVVRFKTPLSRRTALELVNLYLISHYAYEGPARNAVAFPPTIAATMPCCARSWLKQPIAQNEPKSSEIWPSNG
jgi:hypothetical protein